MLEVSEKASQEIIEKAYKTLAKKYHPDLQDETSKKKAEAMMKKINEAYAILGDVEKRKAYDAELKAKRDEAKRIEQEQQSHQEANLANLDNGQLDYEEEKQKYAKRLQQEELKQRQKMQENLNQEYENAYENYLRSLGYKVKHKWTKENFRDFFIVIGIMVIIFIILWLIPPTRQWMIDFYNSNPILKVIVDVIISVVTGIFKGIWNFITGLFN